MFKKVSRLLAMAVVIVTAISMMTINITAENNFVMEKKTITKAPTSEDDLKETLLMSEIDLTYDKATVIPNPEKDVMCTTDDNKVIFVKTNNETTGLTLTDLGKIKFEKVAKIDNRDIDVIISLDKLVIEEQKTDEGVPLPLPDKVQIALFYMESDGVTRFWLCGYPLVDWPVNGKYAWGGRQEIDVTTTVVYNDKPTEIVDHKFICGETDLDYIDKEGIETIEGFTGKYFLYDGDEYTCFSGRDESDDTRLKFTSLFQTTDTVPPQGLGGLFSYTMGGVYLQTHNGTFKTKLHTYHSGNAYRLFSQYKNLNQNPSKKIVDEKPHYNATDEVTFDVNFTMFNWFDTYETYNSLSLYDTIPDGLDFVKAEMIDSKGNPIPGTITVPTAGNGNKVTYAIDKTKWLDKTENYNGKDITLRITTKVNGTITGDIKNIGFANADGKELTTNEVIINVPDVPYISGRIWNDNNKNGLQDAGEKSVAGVTVKLYNDKGEEVGSTVTDKDGNYIFSNIPEGNYTVKAEINFSKYNLTGKNKGNDITIDSDADKIDNLAVIGDITIGADSIVEHMDIGIVEIPRTVVTTTTPTTTAPVTTTTTVTEETTVTSETTVTVPETTAIVSSEETTATTKAEENPVTGNAPVAMLSVAAALAAAMLLINKKRA